MYVRSIFVNKMWFVALFALVMLVVVSNVLRTGIQQIADDQAQAQARINELLK